jgi:hypothetical protein
MEISDGSILPVATLENFGFIEWLIYQRISNVHMIFHSLKTSHSKPWKAKSDAEKIDRILKFSAPTKYVDMITFLQVE